jgi:anti-anti-sigma factor
MLRESKINISPAHQTKGILIMQAVISPSATVMKLQGHLNAANATDLKSQLIAAVSDSKTPVVLIDMEKVESLDSAGLMAFVSALRLSQTIGRRFSLCSVSPSIQIIFELTQLDRVFEMFDNRMAFDCVAA